VRRHRKRLTKEERAARMHRTGAALLAGVPADFDPATAAEYVMAIKAVRRAARLSAQLSNAMSRLYCV
jgi:hypothetical protein